MHLHVPITLICSSEQARFFALQVIEDTLRHRYSNLNASQKLLLRTTLWNLVISSTDSVMADPSYLKNKMAVVLVLLLKHHYPIDWPSFFEDLLSALSVHASSPLFVEFFLRIMLSMDEEIVCLYIQRSHEETARNSDIKDALRAGPIIKLAETWFNILVSYASTPDIANACLRVIGKIEKLSEMIFLLTHISPPPYPPPPTPCQLYMYHGSILTLSSLDSLSTCYTSCCRWRLLGMPHVSV